MFLSSTGKWSRFSPGVDALEETDDSVGVFWATLLLLLGMESVGGWDDVDVAMDVEDVVPTAEEATGLGAGEARGAVAVGRGIGEDKGDEGVACSLPVKRLNWIMSMNKRMSMH